MNTILVVAAHADDETLGCGGTIARHVAEGDIVHLVVMADGVNSRSQASIDDLERRVAASKYVQRILGISSLHSLGFPDNRMDSVSTLQIVQKLERIIQQIQPSIIYTHHYADLNIDHRLTHAAVTTACRPIPGFLVREIYGFEVLSSTDWTFSRESVFIPNYFVDISHTLEIKLKALEGYAEEMRETPHSRSIAHVEVLARHRGYSIGMHAAEAFEAYRIIR